MGWLLGCVDCFGFVWVGFALKVYLCIVDILFGLIDMY